MFMFFFFERSKKERSSKRSSIHFTIFILLVAAAVASGIMSIFIYLGSPTDIFTNDQVEFGNWIAENTPVSAIFIGDKSTEQPVASLGGRAVMSGFPGWIVSHGLDQYQRDDVVRKLMASPNSLKEFDQNGIQYVFLGTTNDYKFNPGEDSEYWQLLYDEVNITLWGRI